MSREELISRLEELCKGAQAVELDSYVIRTVVERLRDGLDLQRQLEQVQEQLTLKPSVAKKLNAKITGLESELTVLRSSTKVDSMEKKIQKLEVELKQSYATKNFTVKSGLLEIEKAYSDFIRSHKDVQALWAEIMLLLVEDKDSLPTSTVAQRRAAMNNSTEQAADAARTPRVSRNSASTHGEMVAVSENELPTAVPEPVVTVAVTQGTSNPSSDDGEGLSGGGALHANSSSYVQSQVYKFKDASAPSSANLSGNSTPLRSASFYQTRLDDRTSDSAPDICDVHTDASNMSFEERSGLFGVSVLTTGDYPLPLIAAQAAGTQPSTISAAALMLRPTSLLTAAGHVDASALEQHASHFLLSISQLRELYRGFSYSPSMPVTGNATPGTSGVNRPATLLPPTSTDVETQMESLIVSVEQMRALFAQTGGNVPVPSQPGHITSSSVPGSALKAPDASSYSTQAEAAMESIQHLRDIFRQAQVAHATVTGGHPIKDGEAKVPDARYFDKQVETLLSSVASLQHLFAASHSPHTSAVGVSKHTITQQQQQQQQQQLPSQLPEANSHPTPGLPTGIQDRVPIVHLLASFLNQLGTQGLYPSSGTLHPLPHQQGSSSSSQSTTIISTHIQPEGSTNGGSVSHQPPTIEQLLQLFSTYLATGQTIPIHSKAAFTAHAKVSDSSTLSLASLEAGPDASGGAFESNSGSGSRDGSGKAEVDVAGTVALLLQLPQQPPLAPSPPMSGQAGLQGSSHDTAYSGSDGSGNPATAIAEHTAGSRSFAVSEFTASSTGAGADVTHSFRADTIIVSSNGGDGGGVMINTNVGDPVNLSGGVDAHPRSPPSSAQQDPDRRQEVQELLSQLRHRHSTLLDTSPAAEALLKDTLQTLSLSQPSHACAQHPHVQLSVHGQRLPQGPAGSGVSQLGTESRLQHENTGSGGGGGLNSDISGGLVEASLVPEEASTGASALSPSSLPVPFSAHQSAPALTLQHSDGLLPPEWTAGFPDPMERISALASLTAHSVHLLPDAACNSDATATTHLSAAPHDHADVRTQEPLGAPHADSPASITVLADPEAAHAMLTIQTAASSCSDDGKLITLGEPVSPTRGSPRHSTRRPTARPRRLHLAPADNASEASQIGHEGSLSDTPSQGPPAKRISLSHSDPNAEGGSAQRTPVRGTSTTLDSTTAEGGSQRSTPASGQASERSITADELAPAVLSATAVSGPMSQAAVRASFPESLAAAYQLAGMSVPFVLPVSTSPSTAAGPGGVAWSSMDQSPSLGVVVEDDLTSGLFHLRDAKAALTEKVIAYEALILKLSEQMRFATEKGDDDGGRVTALTTEMDILAAERVALDRRLQEFQEENMIVTSELIVKKMSLAQLTEEHEKLKKAQREAQSKEQVMLTRIAELERLLSVVTPDETVQLDSSYSMRVRVSTSGLSDSLDNTPTSPHRLGPNSAAAPTIETTGGSSVSIQNALRVSATASHTEDGRPLSARLNPAWSGQSSPTIANGNGDMGFAGAGSGGGGSSGSSSRTGTPGRRRNLSVVPEESFATGSPTRSPTGQEGAATKASTPAVGEGREQPGMARKDRSAN